MDGATMLIDPRLMREVIVLDDDDDDYQEPTPEEPTYLGFNPQLGGAEKNYDRQLDHDRRKQKKKLKSRFEHIFAKYGRDFGGIGDEIDMQSGVIIVDNGHLRNMQHEVDPGNEDIQATAEPDDNEEEDVCAVARELAESEGDAGDDEEDSSDLDDASDSASETGGDTPATQPEELLDQMPSLRDSVLDLQTRQRQGEGIDQSAIEALGMSIAKQLTDIMSRQQKKPAKRKRNEPDDGVGAVSGTAALPAEKRARRSVTPSPDWPGPSPGRKSLWVPLKVPRRQKRKAVEQEEAAEPDNEPAIKPEDANIIPQDQLQQQPIRSCYNCKVSNSVIWRKGPDGIMCNACGMYHYRYGLIRPIGPPVEVEESSSSEELELESDDDDGETTSQYSANTSRHRDQLPQNKHDRFLVEEDVLILKLKEIDRLSWEKIAKHLPARTAYAVQCRYSKKIYNRPVEARAILANQGYKFQHDASGLIVFTPAPTPRGFTDEDDEQLLKLREEEKLDWDTIALSFPERTPKALELRFNQLVKKILTALRNPEKLKKKRKPVTRMYMRYSEEEDELLKKLREVDKLSWAELAERFPGRNAISLQKRYVREISEAAKQRQLLARGVPGGVADDFKHLRYSFEEDAMLLRLRDQEGLSWIEIEQRMPRRLKDSLQHRYNYIYARKEHTTMLQNMALKKQAGDGALSDDELLNDDVDVSFSMLTWTDHLQMTMSTDRTNRDAQPVRAKSEPRDVSRTTDLPSSKKATVPKRAQSEPPVALATSVDHRRKALPEINRFPRRWTAEEDQLLKYLRRQGLDWDQIAPRLPGRTAKAIKSHWWSRFAQPESRQISTVQNTGTSSLLRLAVGNRARHYSGLSFSPGDTTANVIDLTDDEDHLSLYSGHAGLRRPDIPRSKKALLSRRPARSPPESVVNEQQKMLPPSVFAPPRRASHASLSPVKSLPVFAECQPRQMASVLDAPPKVPAIFRTGGIEKMSAGQDAHVLGQPGVSGESLEETSTVAEIETARPLYPASIEGTDSNTDSSHMLRLTASPVGDPSAEALSNSATDSHGPHMTEIIDLSTGPSTICSRPSSRGEMPLQDSNPQTPVEVSRSSSPAYGVPSAPSVNYFTPSRYDAHAHPYFVAPPACMFIPLERVDQQDSTQMFDRSARHIDESDDEIGKLVISEESIKARLKPARKRVEPVRRSARNILVESQRVYDIHVSDSEDESANLEKGQSTYKISKNAAEPSREPTSMQSGSERRLGSSVPIQPPRRKRGRPRKIVTDNAELAPKQSYVLERQQQEPEVRDSIETSQEEQLEDDSMAEHPQLLPPIALQGEQVDTGSEIAQPRERGRPQKDGDSIWDVTANNQGTIQQPDLSASVEETLTDEYADVSQNGAELPECQPPTTFAKGHADLDGDALPQDRKRGRPRNIWSSISDTVLGGRPEAADLPVPQSDEAQGSAETTFPESDSIEAEQTELTAAKLVPELNDFMASEAAPLRRSGRPRKAKSSPNDAVLNNKPSAFEHIISSPSADNQVIELLCPDDHNTQHDQEDFTETSIGYAESIVSPRSASRPPLDSDVSILEDEDELSLPTLSVHSSAPRSSSRMASASNRSAKKHGVQTTAFFSAMKPVFSSDINREPESTPNGPITRSRRRGTELASSDDSPPTSKSAAQAIPSSSPILSMKKPPKAVYRRTSTPGTDRSTLFGRPEHGRVHALRSSFGRSSPAYRSSSVGLPGSRKRIVYTPSKDGNDSEDELA